MDERLALHAATAERLASLSDAEVSALLATTDPHPGWGASRTVELDGSNVFAKALPLTDLELASPYSTENLYELPTFYQYGVGSAGFGVFRELAAHQKASDSVLRGEIIGVPLVYHHRVLAEPAGARELAPDKIEWFGKYWDDSAPVRALLEARRAATHSLVIFIEWFPHVLRTWLTNNPEAIDNVVAGVEPTLEHLRNNGMVHFDANLSNIVTDGEIFALTDFGLALDASFELGADEQAFLKAHHHFDSGEFVACLTDPLEDAADKTDLPASYLETIDRYDGVITYMQAVFDRLQQGSKADGGYDDATLMGLLDQANA